MTVRAELDNLKSNLSWMICHPMRRSMEDVSEMLRAIERSVDKAVDILDNSRETTEKITHWAVPSKHLQYGQTEREAFMVTNHKARIVLDD